jgi:hypothetical protein
VFSKFEGGLDSAFDRAAGVVFRGPIEPAQIAKRAEKQMNREKLVGAGKQYAPTLFTVLVNANDDRKLFGFYPTMAAEIETYLVAKGTQNSLKFDGRPLVRFIVDHQLKSGKFDVIAENVAAPIIAQLRDEEQVFYGFKDPEEVARNRAPRGGPAGTSAILSSAAGMANVAAAGGAGGVALGAGAVGAGVAGASGRAAAPLGAAAAAVGAGASAGAAAGAAAASPRSRTPSVPLSPSASPSAVIGNARLSNLSAGKSYPLIATTMLIGRDSACDIPLADANTSRNHAQLSQDVVGTWKITDLDSTNGTLLNDSPVTSALLRDGDQITVGVTVLEFRETAP